MASVKKSMASSKLPAEKAAFPFACTEFHTSQADRYRIILTDALNSPLCPCHRHSRFPCTLLRLPIFTGARQRLRSIRNT